MDKNNNLQDVVPPEQKRSIRNIPIPSRDKKGEEINITNNNHVIPPIHPEEDKFEDYNKKPKKKTFKKYFIVLGIIILLFLLFSIISSFDSALVKATPKTESASYNEKILIEELSQRSNNESLGYRVIELSQESEKTVEAINEEPVQEKASGEITIFNEYSENSQKLIKNTRFEASDGKIYRILESVEVPGYTEASDGVKPGQITVTVYADEVGEDHNLESDNFKIPGFEGQEPYDFFYAKTVSPITGGFDGIRKIVSEEDIEIASQELKENLKSKLVVELDEQVTEDFYINYNDDSFRYEKITQEEIAESDNVKLKMRGRISAKVFDKKDLSNVIAKNLFANYFTNENTLIDDFDSLNVEITKNEDSGLEFMEITGDSKFVWQINNSQLKKDLVNAEKKTLSTIMQDYTEIKTAEATIKPFWRSAFPEKEKDIKIEIVE